MGSLWTVSDPQLERPDRTSASLNPAHHRQLGPAFPATTTRPESLMQTKGTRLRSAASCERRPSSLTHCAIIPFAFGKVKAVFPQPCRTGLPNERDLAPVGRLVKTTNVLETLET